MSRQEPPKTCAAILAGHLRPELFRALCDPTRLMLVARLATSPEPLTVSEASDCCGIHVSGASRHLAQLRSAGVLEAQRNGREVAYRLDHVALIETLRGFADALESCHEQIAAERVSTRQGAER